MQKYRCLFFFVFFLPLFLPAQQTDYFEWGKQIEIISSVSRTLLDNYIEEPNIETLTNNAIKGMLQQTDRYTKYYTEHDMFEQRLRQAGKMSGVGIVIKNKPQGLSVREVLENSPAQKKGLLPGDLIIKIDGTDLKDLKFSAKADLLKGKPGTKVKITFIRRGKIKETEMERAIIEQKAVPLYLMLDNKTGYIKLNRFSTKAYQEVLNALMDLKNQGAEYLILDLRSNPGGLLNQAIKILGLFIPKNSLVVSTRGRLKKFNKEYHTKNEPVDEKIPLAVLINGRSASASEIVSGALQDYDRAVIVGDTSFGKGLVQRFFPLKYGTYMKVTISKYYIPSGRQIQKIDYWHRNKKGNPLHYKQDHSKVFHTRNNRPVYEHGGITPDIVIVNDTKDSRFNNLDKNDAIFDFCNEFYFQNPGKDPSKLTEDIILRQFISYLKKNNIDPQSDFEKQLEKDMKKAEEEHLSLEIRRKLKEIESQLDKDDFNQLENNPELRKELFKKIKSCLIERYQGKEKALEFLLQNDLQLEKAKETLQSGKFRHILKNIR